MKRILIIYFCAASIVLNGSCKKFLDEKPDKKLAIATTPDDLRLLLDDPFTLNFLYPLSTSIVSDEYYLTDNDWNGLSSETYRNLYLWKKDGKTEDWQAYQAVYLANIVIDEADKMVSAGTPGSKEVRAAALFFRSFYFYALLQLYAPPYNEQTAATDPGIVLRLSSDFNIRSTRSSVKACYDQVITDLHQAIPFLPAGMSLKTRPTRAAAYGLLARIYLTTDNYTPAGAYADSCLQLQDDLMDFNLLDSTSLNPVARYNPEVIFHCRSYTASPLSFSVCRIDSVLMGSYEAGDLRRAVCFHTTDNQTYAFKGDYDGQGLFGSGFTFGGITTDEQYLIRAEARARTGQPEQAVADLNTLLVKRFLSAYFQPVTTTDPDELLDIILAERRKELLFRGTRWTDMRRLRAQATLNPQRLVEGHSLTLRANANNYTLFIPENIITLTGIEQNPE